jgi:hypothetical protein
VTRDEWAATPRQRIRARRLALHQLLRRHAVEFRALYRTALRAIRDREDNDT